MGDRGVPKIRVESRLAEALTVCWMLSAVATFFSVSASAATKVVIVAFKLATNATQSSPGIMVLFDVLLFTATATGSLSILLVIPVYLYRRLPPPSTITMFSIVIGVIPWITNMIFLLRDG